MPAKETIDPAVALQRAHQIVEEAGEKSEGSLRLTNLLDFLSLTGDVIKSWSAERRVAEPSFKELLQSLASLRDDAAKIVADDPVILYRPQHNVADDFHKSRATIRYFFGGNRISKTQAGGVDNAWIATGRHPIRRKGRPGSVFIVGTDYQHYKLTFEKKYVIGEPDNPLSPLFPEGGKWLHHYDKKNYTLYIACPECARKGAPTSCKHLQTISLHSDKSDSLGLAGGQYAQGQFDEPVKEGYFGEAKQRLKTVSESSLIVTETPLLGESHWTYQILYKLGMEGRPRNWLEDEQRPIVSLHTIDQFSAGLTAPDQIIADMRTMAEYEIQCRIFGRHVNASTQSIFDLSVLLEMQRQTQEPERGDLLFDGELKFRGLENFLAWRVEQEAKVDKKRDAEPLADLSLGFHGEAEGPLHLWSPPTLGSQYVIGADCAEGLAEGDGNVAHVYEMIPWKETMLFRLVALVDCQLDSRKYGDLLYRLSCWFNDATLVIENNSYGAAVILHMNEALNCPNLFRDMTNVSDMAFNSSASYGINTNIRSKKMLIAVLQSLVKLKRELPNALTIPSKTAVSQLQSYVQEKNKNGTGYVMKGAGSSHDDHVMAAALATYAGTTQSVYDFEGRLAFEKAAKAAKKGLTEDEKAVWEMLRQEEQELEHRNERDFL